MAGGLGTRLRPLTEDTPKPMLKVGNKPILETIIKNFAAHGFINITISLNYKAEMIKEYFKDGSDFGVNIDYVEENIRLGTAGALSLLKDQPNEPFFVMNADLLTDVNFSNLLDFHCFGNANGTMCVREYEYQVPYGVIEIENSSIIIFTFSKCCFACFKLFSHFKESFSEFSYFSACVKLCQAYVQITFCHFPACFFEHDDSVCD